jgi:hypothetical protein
MLRLLVRSRIKLLSCLGGFLVLGILSAIFCVGQAVNNLYYRHQQAYQRWQSRQPDHYHYRIAIRKMMITRYWQVEVRQGKVVRMTEIQSSSEVEMQSWFQSTTLAPLTVSSSNDLIDATFIAIQKALVPARSPGEFMARLNPEFYQKALEVTILPGGWDHCNPPFPQVRYHPVYGFPEEALLSGLPCVASLDLGSPTRIMIEDFQLLP